MLKPRVAGSLVPLASNGSGAVGQPYTYNLSATYIAGCQTTLVSLACPPGYAVVSGASSGPGATFACTCGSLTASERVNEDTLDYIMAPFMAGVSASAAAARAASSCPAEVVLAFWIAIAVLGGVLLLLALVYAGRCGYTLWHRGGAEGGTTDWGAATTNPAKRY